MTESPRTVIAGVAVLLAIVGLVVGGVLMLQRVSATRGQILAEEARQKARLIATEARDRAREIDAEAAREMRGDAGSGAVARAVLEGVQGLVAAARSHLSAGRPEAALALLDAAAQQIESPALRGSPDLVWPLHRSVAEAYEASGKPAAALLQWEGALQAARAVQPDDLPAGTLESLEAATIRLRLRNEPGNSGAPEAR